jgi:hypothetical protein
LDYHESASAVGLENSMPKACLALLVVAFCAIACSPTGLPPTPASVTPPLPSTDPRSSLLAAATSVTFAGKTLTLESSPWRNFQFPYDTLIMLLTVKTMDGSAVPSGVSVDSAWALNDSDMWSASPLTPQTPQQGFKNFAVQASGGPRWPVGSLMTAVVLLRDAAGNTVLLRAPDQPIQLAF